MSCLSKNPLPSHKTTATADSKNQNQNKTKQKKTSRVVAQMANWPCLDLHIATPFIQTEYATISPRCSSFEGIHVSQAERSSGEALP